jgi:hypothetical protein
MAETLSVEIAPPEPTGPSLIEEAAAQEAATTNPTPTTPEVPAKFKRPDGTVDYEALARSYTELERKLGAPKEETPSQEEVKTEEAPEATPEAPTEEQAKEALENTGLDLNAMSTRFWESGAVADEDYAALEKAGIPRSFVDAFAEGQKALMQAAQTTVFNMVDGESNYVALTEWAAANLSEAEVNAYNEAVNSNDLGKVQQAVLGLKARHEARVGFEPKRTVSGNAKPVVDVYESVAQLTADMANPLYGKDPAFRAKVEAKLARSNIM